MNCDAAARPSRVANEDTALRPDRLATCSTTVTHTQTHLHTHTIPITSLQLCSKVYQSRKTTAEPASTSGDIQYTPAAAPHRIEPNRTAVIPPGGVNLYEGGDRSPLHTNSRGDGGAVLYVCLIALDADRRRNAGPLG